MQAVRRWGCDGMTGFENRAGILVCCGWYCFNPFHDKKDMLPRRGHELFQKGFEQLSVAFWGSTFRCRAYGFALNVIHEFHIPVTCILVVFAINI